MIIKNKETGAQYEVAEGTNYIESAFEVVKLSATKKADTTAPAKAKSDAKVNATDTAKAKVKTSAK